MTGTCEYRPPNTRESFHFESVVKVYPSVVPFLPSQNVQPTDDRA